MSDPVAALIASENLPADYADIVEQHWKPLATRIARMPAARAPLVIGINGAQGSGKSTLCKFLEVLLAKRQIRAVTLSLDDLYLTKAERQQLADEVHPLFATRGVPGTHAVGLGLAVLEEILAGRPFDLPRFDKATDDRAEHGERITGPVDVLLLEGWCVGAKPQDAEALAEPVNDLEAEEDPDGLWRGLVNHWLSEDYAKLFDQIDLLVMLKVDSFDDVLRNRTLQEEKLAKANPEAPGLMDEAALARFCAHYERLTRHMLEEMPGRADVVIPIGADQRPKD
ncbi:kinase [Aurantiacibacter sp. MUD11]|uniref:P-loop NTPase fold protein n=1 Tax=Aurantiacibacter sp. MUD11 TaxID=3003265 RepID=UPI0022AA7A2A|nr:P-loop NTPase fold protein [Aurantiacibacter sp. MUD11]WAT18896.1 kinase [Aurantiacibacter sp. MUD11]